MSDIIISKPVSVTESAIIKKPEIITDLDHDTLGCIFSFAIENAKEQITDDAETIAFFETVKKYKRVCKKFNEILSEDSFYQPYFKSTSLATAQEVGKRRYIIIKKKKIMQSMATLDSEICSLRSPIADNRYSHTPIFKASMILASFATSALFSLIPTAFIPKVIASGLLLAPSLGVGVLIGIGAFMGFWGFLISLNYLLSLGGSWRVNVDRTQSLTLKLLAASFIPTAIVVYFLFRVLSNLCMHLLISLIGPISLLVRFAPVAISAIFLSKLLFKEIRCWWKNNSLYNSYYSKTNQYNDLNLLKNKFLT